MERELSSGRQDYDTDKNLWPLNQPLPKMDALYQTSGEAQYANDIPPFSNEVFCAFVLATVPNGEIESIDPSEALKMKGVVGFFSAKDIPGKNLFISAAAKQPTLYYDDVLFAEKKIQYPGQPVGVIVATTHLVANEAAGEVRVSYVDVMKEEVIVTIEDAVSSNDETRVTEAVRQDAKTKGN